MFTYPILTVSTSEGLRVEITFDKFIMNGIRNYLFVGDGLSGTNDTILARFNGNALPSNVISVTSSAWFTLQAPLESKVFDLHLTVTAKTFTGTTNLLLMITLLNMGLK